MEIKLKTFNTANVIATRKGVESVGINIKSGLFGFTKSACVNLGLTSGTQIQFFQDENDPANWYLEIVEKDGFVLRKQKDLSSLFFNNTEMARKIFKSVEYEGEYGKVLIGETISLKNRNLHTLITAKLKS